MDYPLFEESVSSFHVKLSGIKKGEIQHYIAKAVAMDSLLNPGQVSVGILNYHTLQYEYLSA